MWREKKWKKLTKKTKFCYFFSVSGPGRRGPWEQAWVFLILALVLARLIIAAWFRAVKMAAQRGEFVAIAASQTVGITYGLFFLYLIVAWVIQERKLHRVQRRVLDLCPNARKMTTSPLHQVISQFKKRFPYFTRQFIASHRIKILFICKLNRQFEVTRTKFYSMTCFKIFS